MINIINNQSCKVTAKDEETLSKRKDYKEIMDAIGVIAKHCDGVAISGVAKNDDFFFTYHYLNENQELGVTTPKHMSKDDIKGVKRGTDIANQITNLLLLAQSEYDISRELILETVASAFDVIDNMNSDEVRELNQKLGNVKTSAEGKEILREKIKTFREGSHSASKPANGVFGNGLPYCEANKKETAEILEKMRKATGNDKINAYDISKTEGLEALLAMLSNKLNATITLGIIKAGKDGRAEKDDNISKTIVHFQPDLDEIAKRSRHNITGDELRLISLGSVAMSFIQTAMDDFGKNKPKNFFSKYLKEAGL